MNAKKGYNYRKLWRILHRDFGYFIVGITLMYALSGIALNHMYDWNPNYIVTEKEVVVKPDGSVPYSKEEVITALSKAGADVDYKKHFKTSRNTIKVFVDGGTVEFNADNGSGWLEVIKKRPVFFAINNMHYGKHHIWKWISDIYAVLLIIVSITGIVILKGKNGITRRGLWLTLAGLVGPAIFIIMIFS
ncbi:hypothetical protein EMN47_01880 [Prolixibacteraceae bacterium JC049]|nr:hypothetical protein [Prolixibacteraceae bacterium JC049]